MSFYNIFAILFKDLIDITKSKAVWITLATPVILSLFFKLAFSHSDTLPSIGICDNGKSGFTDFLKNSKAFDIEEIAHEEEGRKRISEKKIICLVMLPSDFDDELSRKELPHVDILMDTNSNKESEVLLAGLLEIFRSYSGQIFPVELEIKEISETVLTQLQVLLPMWVLLTIMGGLVITTSSLIEEKEKKTMEALLVSPASIYDVIIGKGLLGFILTSFSSTVLLILNGGFTGNLTGLILIIAAGSICFSLWGIFIGLISPSQTTANSINSLTFILLMIPVMLAETSKILWFISRCLPSYYLADGISKSISGEITICNLYIHYLFLMVLSAVLFLCCLKSIKKVTS